MQSRLATLMYSLDTYNLFGSAYYTGMQLVAVISLAVRYEKEGAYYTNSCHNRHHIRKVRLIIIVYCAYMYVNVHTSVNVLIIILYV